jgi:hypothetical protein
MMFHSSSEQGLGTVLLTRVTISAAPTSVNAHAMRRRDWIIEQVDTVIR